MVTKIIEKNIDFKDFNQQKTFKIKVDESTSQELTMILLLLREDLAKSVEIKFNNFNFYISLLKKSNLSLYDKLDERNKIFKCQISLNSLEYLLYFLLKYYRDRIGESNHVDIDFLQGKEECTLTVECEKFKEYSPEEINKLLGI